MVAFAGYGNEFSEAALSTTLGERQFGELLLLRFGELSVFWKVGVARKLEQASRGNIQTVQNGPVGFGLKDKTTIGVLVKLWKLVGESCGE